MGSLVWAVLQRRWLWVIGLVLAVGGAFLGPASRPTQLIGFALLLVSMALNVTGARRRIAQRRNQQSPR